MVDSTPIFTHNENSYHSVNDGVDIWVTPTETKTDDGIEQYLLEASYCGLVSKTLVEVTTLNERTSYVEHLSLDGLLIASMMIVDNRVVSLEYNEDATDDYLGIPETRSLSSFFKCVGERYKQLREVVDSDGELMVLCDVLVAVCPAEMATAAAIKCLID